MEYFACIESRFLTHRSGKSSSSKQLQYTADHDELVKKINRLHEIVSDLTPGVSGSVLLLKELAEYEALVKPHLLQEEIECLPLCRAYFTPEEIGVKVQEILSHGPKIEMGSFIHASKFIRSDVFLIEVSYSTGSWCFWFCLLQWESKNSVRRSCNKREYHFLCGI